MRRTPARIRSGALALAALLAFSAEQALAQASGGAAGNQAAPGQAAAQLELIPATGPVAENIRVVAAGLPANARAMVLGGADPQTGAAGGGERRRGRELPRQGQRARYSAIRQRFLFRPESRRRDRRAGGVSRGGTQARSGVRRPHISVAVRSAAG